MLVTDTFPSADELAPFLAARHRMLHIAKRIVGSASDAEDVVQDAWLRWNGTDRFAVRNPDAFLCSTTTRLSITAIRTAHVRHRSPAQLSAAERPDPGDGPDVVAVRADQVQAAMLLLVERLAPREQAAFILREAFGYPYRDLGDVLALTEATARQLVSRSRIRLGADRHRPASRSEQLRLLGAFLHAARTGDPGALADLARQPEIQQRTTPIPTSTDGDHHVPR
jgi:RNA polymerase sigma factor (sigma-70 family)